MNPKRRNLDHNQNNPIEPEMSLRLPHRISPHVLGYVLGMVVSGVAAGAAMWAVQAYKVDELQRSNAAIIDRLGGVEQRLSNLEGAIPYIRPYAARDDVSVVDGRDSRD